MKICICTTATNLDSLVSPVFARTPYFLFVDSKTEKFKSVPNQVAQYGRGAGVTASQEVASQGAEVVISGNIGPNAFNLLKAAGIKIYNAIGLTAREALEQYKQNKLKEISEPSGRFGLGLGRGLGQGRGRGFGRGQGFGRRNL